MRKSEIENFRKQLDEVPCEIVRRLTEAGHEAYIVGGAIRDLLLGEVPKDYDITTSATPEQVRAVFGRRRCIVIGRRFRLALVNFNGVQYEVSTFRATPKATQDEDGNALIWDDNTYGSQEDDAFRRDFTANAIYFDVAGDKGFIDKTGGMADIRKKTVKCIGDPEVRFNEDPVRMLRAIKLCGQYGFKLSAAVKKAIKNNAQKIQLAAPARLFEELLKILVSPKSIMIFRALQEYGFLDYFWPTLAQSWDEDEGIWFQKIMEKRCESLANDAGYPHSKGLALSTACFAFQMSAMSPGEEPQLWQRGPDVDMITHKVIQLVFSDFAMPKIFSARIHTIMNLVPRLTLKPISQKALRNIEFNNAMALADTLADTFDWKHDGLDLLHSPNFQPPKPRLRPLIDPFKKEDKGEVPKTQTDDTMPKKHHHRRHRSKKSGNSNSESLQNTL